MTPHTDFRIPDFSFIQNLANSGHIIEKKQECWKNIFQDPMSLTIQSWDPVKKWKKTINRIIKNWKRWIVRFFLNFSSVQFSCSLISNSLRPHGLQHARLLLELTQTHVHWVGDAIQPSHPRSSLSSCLQSFPASGSFPMSQFFPSSGESIGASASAPVLPMNIQNWFPLGLTGVISVLSKGLSKVFSNTTVQNHQFFVVQPCLWSNSHSIHNYWKNHSFACMDFCR